MTKRKPTKTEALEQAESDAAADAAVDRQALLDNDEDEDEGPTANEYSIAFTPRNVAVGLAIVAGLVALAASRHRRKRDAGSGDR
jgi:uncharacterized membrane protein